MKIAFGMINCNRRDGSARAVNEVAERLAHRHRVTIFARKVEDLDCSAIQWRRVRGPNRPEVVDFASYHLLANHSIRPGDYDIVHSIGCNTLRANVVTIQNVQPAKTAKLGTLATREEIGWARRLSRWMYRTLTSHAERRLYEPRAGRLEPMFLPVSRGVEEELRKHYRIGGALVKIIPNAADTQKFKPLPEDLRLHWREAQGLRRGDCVLIFVGGEWLRKGLDLAIQALALIPDERVKLYVAGDDAERQRYFEMSRGLGLAKRVIFGGFRNDIATALASSDAFLFPSWYEAFSLATIEAAASGIPIFATRINGAEDFIQPSVNGHFITHIPEQIANTVSGALRESSALQTMGAAARSLVERSYTWDRVAQMTEAAYNEYLEHRRRVE